MHTTAPDGRAYDVSRRWSWRHRGWVVYVHDLDAPRDDGDAPVVMTEKARGWAAARAHEKSLAGLIATRQLAPPRPGHLAIRRQSVAMGDDACDNTLFAPLPSGVRLRDVLDWLEGRGPFISAGNQHTWLLREDPLPGNDGKMRALAVLDLRTPRDGAREIHVHPVADLDHRVGAETSLRLEYLLAQDVHATLDLIERQPQGPFRIR